MIESQFKWIFQQNKLLKLQIESNVCLYTSETEAEASVKYFIYFFVQFTYEIDNKTIQKNKRENKGMTTIATIHNRISNESPKNLYTCAETSFQTVFFDQSAYIVWLRWNHFILQKRKKNEAKITLVYMCECARTKQNIVRFEVFYWRGRSK